MSEYIDEKLVAQLAPPKTGRATTTDAEIPGFYVRLSSTGTLGLYLTYRVKKGTEKGVKRNHHMLSSDLATFQSMTKTMQRQVARAWRATATETRALVIGGHDPAAEVKDARTIRKAEAAERKAKLAEKQAQATAKELAKQNTINALTSDEGAYTKSIARSKSNDGTRKMLQSAWAEVASSPVSDITHSRVSAIADDWYSTKKGKPKSEATIDRYVDALRAFMNWCKEKRLVTTNPCDGIDRKRGSFHYSEDYKALEPEQVIAICEAIDADDKIPQWFSVLVKLAIRTGLRRGELLQVKWGDLHVAGKSALLTVHKGITKTNKTRRQAVNDEVVAIWREWKAQSGRTVSPSDKVFPGEHEQLVNKIKRYWPRACDAAEVHGYGFHSLRHTFAVSLARKSVAIQDISEAMGHTTLEMTLRYMREAPGTKRPTEKLLKMFG